MPVRIAISLTFKVVNVRNSMKYFLNVLLIVLVTNELVVGGYCVVRPCGAAGS